MIEKREREDSRWDPKQWGNFIAHAIIEKMDDRRPETVRKFAAKIPLNIRAAEEWCRDNSIWDAFESLRRLRIAYLCRYKTVKFPERQSVAVYDEVGLAAAFDECLRLLRMFGEQKGKMELASDEKTLEVCAVIKEVVKKFKGTR